jgi:hypothetical protein
MRNKRADEDAGNNAVPSSEASSYRVCHSAHSTFFPPGGRGVLFHLPVQWRTMKRSVFTILSALSLAWCIIEVATMLYIPWKHGPSESVKFDMPVEMPNWLSIAIFAVLPMTWISAYLCSKWRNSTRHKMGCCLTCGYDLRASPDRCPECGTETKVARISAGEQEDKRERS